jgi:hypothetical protein
MQQVGTALIVEHWAIGFFVLAVIGLCAFMIGVSALLGGRSGESNLSLRDIAARVKQQRDV